MTSALETQLDRLIELHLPRAIELRRDLHRHPELSWQEHRTQTTLRRFLVEGGVEGVRDVAGTGLVADVGGDAPRVLYRADIDALPILDTKDPAEFPWASTHAGCSHACGHDVHASIGALLATCFAGLGADSHGVRFVFQPAEEVIPSGGELVVASGVLEGVRSALAVHVDPTREAGHVALRSGPVTASTDGYLVRVRGRGGHSARPHLSHDALYAAAEVVRALYAVVPLQIDPLQPAVLNAGVIRGGRARNVIAEEIEIEGTARAVDPDVRVALRAALVAAAENAARLNGCSAQVEFFLGAPSVVNDEHLTRIVRDAAVDALGAGFVHPLPQPSTGAEDFGFYSQRTRTFLMRLGVRLPGQDIRHLHTPGFDVDERAIAVAARVMGRALLRARVEERSDV